MQHVRIVAAEKQNGIYAAKDGWARNAVQSIVQGAQEREARA